MLTLLLALCLIVTPPDADELPAQLFHLSTQAQDLVIQWEILDPRECRYMLARKDEFTADVKLIHRRWQQLRDAPPLHDAMRFPDRAMVNDLLSFNRQYRQHLTNLGTFELVYPWELRDVMQETDQLYQLWDLVRDAKCEFYYPAIRRHSLKKLRDQLGHKAYYSGSLPPHVPVWRFGRLDK